MNAGDILALAPNGTYTLAGTVALGFETLPGGNWLRHTEIHGNGATVSGGAVGLYVAGKNYIDVKDLNFGASPIWNAHITNANDITLTDCDFYNPATGTTYDCFRADNVTRLTLTRCTAHSSTDFDATRAHDGFELWGPVSNVTFTDCVAYNIKSGATVQEGHGFEVYGQDVGQICATITYTNCEAYNCQVGFSCEGGPNGIAHTNVLCDGCASHDNAFYGYEGIDGATLNRANVAGHDNTDNAGGETFGSVVDV